MTYEEIVSQKCRVHVFLDERSGARLTIEAGNLCFNHIASGSFFSFDSEQGKMARDALLELFPLKDN